jgi:hypothetical protein
MSEVITPPEPLTPVERKCRIEEVFDPGFIELLQLAPQNPYLRALILKLTGKMPGEECGTFEQVQEWTESTCEKRARRNGSTERGRHGGISIDVEFSETEYGRANYSVPRAGSAEFELGAEELLEIVRTAFDDGEGLDKIVERVAAKIDADAWEQCEPSMEDYGDYDYDNHDSADSGNSETNYSREQIRTRLLAFVRERHPELAAEL